MNLNDSRNTDAVKALFTSTSSAIAERHHSLDRQISYNRVCVCVYLQIIARTSSEFLSEIERQSIQLLDPGLSSSEELIREVAVEHDLSDPISIYIRLACNGRHSRATWCVTLARESLNNGMGIET